MTDDIKRDHLLQGVADYYSDKLAQHGPVARGVDWNGEAGQETRFRQLLRIVDDPDVLFSINDLGCGYGALIEHLEGRFPRFDYRGFDIAPSMVECSRERYGSRENASFAVAAVPDRIADYTVASGILNVRLNSPSAEWERHVSETLDVMSEASRRGFAFNCLTSYSDVDRMKASLHYMNPANTFDLCMRRYSRNVALLHDYTLYEFTILVRKSS